MEIPGVDIMREIGRGATAVIYLGRQATLDRLVAVKVLQAKAGCSLRQVDRFMREARIIAQLQHPAIVDIYDFGETEDGALYYVMPYLANGNLRDLKWNDEVRLIQSLVHLCDGLHHAHDQGIVHRDLKPENVLLNAVGMPQVTDFGIAYSKSSRRLTDEGVTVGSPCYMSPEQARSRPVDARSDIYSFGAMMFELLTGSAPYRADDELEVLLAHVEAPLPDLPERLAHWQPIVHRCLAKDPADRYTDMAALKQALVRLAEQLRDSRRGRGAFGWKAAALAGGALVIIAAVAAINLASDEDRAPMTLAVTVPEASTQQPYPAEADPALPLDLPVVSATEYDQRLREAHEHIDAGRLASPPGANALDELRPILALHPANPEALAALEELTRRLAARIEDRLAAGVLNDVRRDAATLAEIRNTGWLGDARLMSLLVDHQARYATLIAELLVAEGATRPESYRLMAHQLGVDIDTVLSRVPRPDAAPASDLREEIVIPPEVRNPSGEVHEVLSPYVLAVHEISVGEFRQFAEDQEPSTRRCRNPANPFGRRSWRDPGFEQSDDHPVVCVSWEDAAAYARWFSERTGHVYRLPSEREWEHAAWAGTDAEIPCEAGNVAGSESGGGLFARPFDCDDGYRTTAPTGRFQGNRLGIHDLRGNVREWTVTCAGGSSSDDAPCRQRVVRGTSWWDDRRRDWLTTREEVPVDVGYTNIGFRLVRELACASPTAC